MILGFVLKFEISDAIENRNDRIESQTPGEKLIVQTYCQDVESNEMNAEKKYIGNRYYIIGTIQDIERFGTEIEVDVIDSDSGKRFTFYPYDENDVSVLKEGYRVKATGTLTGLFHHTAGYFEKSVFTLVVE